MVKPMPKRRGFEVVAAPFRQYPDLSIKRPVRGSRHSAGYDFFSPVALRIAAGQRAFVVTDIKAYMQSDEVLMVYPRSSVGIRAVMLTNTVAL